MANKLFKCPFCDRKYLDKASLYDHMSSVHSNMMAGLPAAQVYFNFRNKYALNKTFGKSIISNKPTKFNLTTERYEKFANDAEKEQYRQLFVQRMRSKYKKDTLLDDPEQQEKMLANRGISGVYVWDDGEKTTYTGSYEKKFLEFLNLNYDWDAPADIEAPAPIIIDYVGSDGKPHFHIPDFYIQSLNMIVNIKSSTNQGYRLRDIENEKLQDAAIAKTDYNYVKIYDGNFQDFAKAVAYLQSLDPGEPEKRICVY